MLNFAFLGIAGWNAKVAKVWRMCRAARLESAISEGVGDLWPLGTSPPVDGAQWPKVSDPVWRQFDFWRHNSSGIKSFSSLELAFCRVGFLSPPSRQNSSRQNSATLIASVVGLMVASEIVASKLSPLASRLHQLFAKLVRSTTRAPVPCPDVSVGCSLLSHSLAKGW